MTLDDRLHRAAHEVQGRFEGLEPLPLPATVPRRRFKLRTSKFAFAAGVFLTVIALGAVLLWIGPFTDENPDVADEIGPPNGQTVTTPSPNSTVVDAPAVPYMNWQRAPSQSSLGDGSASQYEIDTVTTGTTGGPGLIAGGSVIPPGSAWQESPTVGDRAAIWVSEDGIRWDRIPHDEDVFGGPGGTAINDIAAGGPGYVAVGASVADSGGDIDPAVWVSEDGLSWERVVSPSFEDPGSQWMESVSSGGPGVVAVGLSLDGTGEGIWTSPDGLRWERVEVEPFSAANAIWHVMQRGQGLVAVGAISHQPTAWSSEDGISWERGKMSPADAELVGAHPHAVVATDETLLAAGFAAKGSFAKWETGVWLSSDGARWQRVPNFGNNSSFTDVDIQGLASTPEGVVAAGSWWNQADTKSRAAIWVSIDDGGTWSEIPNEGGVFAGSSEIDTGIRDVTVFGDSLVAVGWDGNEATSWVGR